MFTRVVNVQFQPGKVSEAAGIVKDSIVPAMRQLKGFKGQLFFIDTENDRAVSINMWETREDLAAFEGSALYGRLMGKIAGIMAGPPAGSSYAVGVMEL